MFFFNISSIDVKQDLYLYGINFLSDIIYAIIIVKELKLMEMETIKRFRWLFYVVIEHNFFFFQKNEKNFRKVVMKS